MGAAVALMSNGALCESAYSQWKVRSCSSAEIMSASWPRPVGTRKKTLHCTAPTASTNSTISGSSPRLWRVTVVLTCALNPTSRALCRIFIVRSHEPGTWRKASCTSAEGASRLRATRRTPASFACRSRSTVGRAVAVGVREARRPRSLQ